MKTDSNQQTILITGCSSGIGRTTAFGLKQRGYRVFASARKVANVEELNRAGLEAVHLDLTDSASIKQAVDTVLAQSDGELTALFNNGAFGQPGAVEDLSREVLLEQFQTNLFGTHELTKLVIPVMRKQGHGRILYNSSVLGLVAMSYRGAYNASKYALEGLADTLRLELHGSNIHVILIEPGPILSKFRDNSYKMYKKNIDPTRSVHRKTYEAMEKRLRTKGPAVPFTLPPEAVLKKVIHALESETPKIRYYVTLPTYLFALLRRILPERVLDTILRQV